MGLVVFIKGVIDQGILERRTLFLSYTLTTTKLTILSLVDMWKEILMGLVVFIKGVIDQGILERRMLFLSYTLTTTKLTLIEFS